METTFHPSLTLVPLLANCSLSLCTLSLTESPPITYLNLPFLFLAAQSEDLPLFRFLVLSFVFLVESKLFMGLRRPVLRWVRSVPMTFVVSLPQWRSTATGRSPRCLTRPPGAPVRCLPPFTCATFSMSLKVFAHWVRSWLGVRGSRSPHLFPICSGGGGGSVSPLSPLLRGSITCFIY